MASLVTLMKRGEPPALALIILFLHLVLICYQFDLISSPILLLPLSLRIPALLHTGVIIKAF